MKYLHISKYIKEYIKIVIVLSSLISCMMLVGCNNKDSSKGTLDFASLEQTGEIELEYASRFRILMYGDYRMIEIESESNIFIVPENGEMPCNLPDDTIVLKQPLDKTYLVSTSAMDLIRECGALDYIRLSGTKESDWYIAEAQLAMQNGSMLYAGKYSAPDYELILNEKCNLAIENTMIYHNPEVKEKLESLDIPVIVEHSSYEVHPLGRLEWIKFYGTLFGKEEEAVNYFNQQTALLSEITESDFAGKTVAFFYVTTNGSVNVRKPNDYIAKMIEMAGGEYILNGMDVEEDNSLSTMNMQMEAFYELASEADIIIYNSTIVGELGSTDDLLAMDALFKDFKAVKNGKVYCTSKNFFQETTGTAEFIRDMNNVLNDYEGDFYYLKKL